MSIRKMALWGFGIAIPLLRGIAEMVGFAGLPDDFSTWLGWMETSPAWFWFAAALAFAAIASFSPSEPAENRLGKKRRIHEIGEEALIVGSALAQNARSGSMSGWDPIPAPLASRLIVLAEDFDRIGLFLPAPHNGFDRRLYAEKMGAHLLLTGNLLITGNKAKARLYPAPNLSLGEESESQPPQDTPEETQQ